MKRSGGPSGDNDIASFFRKHEAKKIAASSSSSNGFIGDDAPVLEEEPPQAPTIDDEAPVPEVNAPPAPIYDVNRLESDPGLRLPISSYPANDQDSVRRAYILKGQWQKYSYQFPARNIYGKQHQFSFVWFHKYSWLEYSVAKDAGFCMVCYLFGNESSNFVKGGWRNWNKSDALDKHVGAVTSAHNKAQ